MLGMIIGAAIASELVDRCSDRIGTAVAKTVIASAVANTPAKPVRPSLPGGSGVGNYGLPTMVNDTSTMPDYYCEYCDCFVPAGVWICSHCGAPVDRRSARRNDSRGSIFPQRY
ncbi:MAG: hypothetical protein PUF77_05335 [Clostridiales bacterium]|nr:hypothetical protein [Clostridiales bacterium]